MEKINWTISPLSALCFSAFMLVKIRSLATYWDIPRNECASLELKLTDFQPFPENALRVY